MSCFYRIQTDLSLFAIQQLALAAGLLLMLDIDQGNTPWGATSTVVRIEQEELEEDPASFRTALIARLNALNPFITAREGELASDGHPTLLFESNGYDLFVREQYATGTSYSSFLLLAFTRQPTVVVQPNYLRIDPDYVCDPTDPDLEEPTVPSTTPTYGAGILPAVAVAAGLRAYLDETVGWHKSLSNVAVTGPTGISQPLTWDLEDPDTDVGYLNSHDITTLIQHLGFRFWGNHTCSDDPNFMFEVATRTAHVLLDTMVEGVFPFIDKPLTPILARDIIDSINAKLREIVKSQRLIGATCWYDPEADGNSTQALQMGQFFIEYDYTPVPTLELLGLNQHITSRYLVDFAKLIAA